MSEHHAADWPRQVADRVGRERQNSSCQRIKRWEKKAAEDQRGQSVVGCEVIPLERRSNRAGCCKPAGACSCAATTLGRQIMVDHGFASSLDGRLTSKIESDQLTSFAKNLVFLHRQSGRPSWQKTRKRNKRFARR